MKLGRKNKYNKINLHLVVNLENAVKRLIRKACASSMQEKLKSQVEFLLFFLCVFSLTF